MLGGQKRCEKDEGWNRVVCVCGSGFIFEMDCSMNLYDKMQLKI